MANVPAPAQEIAEKRASASRHHDHAGDVSRTSSRTLGLWSSVALVVGITIGSGIFRSPAGIAQKVPDPTVMLLLWVAGGAITLCGALSIGELAAALPGDRRAVRLPAGRLGTSAPPSCSVGRNWSSSGPTRSAASPSSLAILAAQLQHRPGRALSSRAVCRRRPSRSPPAVNIRGANIGAAHRRESPRGRSSRRSPCWRFPHFSSAAAMARRSRI